MMDPILTGLLIWAGGGLVSYILVWNVWRWIDRWADSSLTWIIAFLWPISIPALVGYYTGRWILRSLRPVGRRIDRWLSLYVFGHRIQDDEYGTLYKTRIPGGDEGYFVEVKDKKSGRRYRHPVPDPAIRSGPAEATAHAAVAWLAGCSPDDYHPKYEA